MHSGLSTSRIHRIMQCIQQLMDIGMHIQLIINSANMVHIQANKFICMKSYNQETTNAAEELITEVLWPVGN